MHSSGALCCFVLLIAGSCVSAKQLSAHDDILSKPIVVDPANHGLDLDMLPENVAVMIGDTVTFRCYIDSTSASPRHQWTEYTYTPSGGLISDAGVILPGHPQSARYSLVRDDPYQYDLVISDVTLEDGGLYQCSDAQAPTSEKQRHSAQLIVIANKQNCSSHIPDNGLTVEGLYYTVECIVDFGGDIVPFMRWDGPRPFGQAQSNTPTRIWSGMSFYADRTMTGQYWDSTFNFTSNFLPVPIDTADNIPLFRDIYDTPRILVQWGPRDMYVDGIKPLNEYYVGDRLECVADAFPTADFEWHNLRTNERFPGSVLFIPPEWLNTQQGMRCQAANVINGLPISNDIVIDVWVVDIPTIPTTTLPPTTTTPPPVSQCLTFNGRWESIRPSDGQMCLEVDPNGGMIHGVLRNATDTFWIDLVGLTDLATNDHITFTGIWPQNRAVSSFIGQCSRCNGVEIMLVSAISRQKGGPPCATPGVIQYSVEFEFRRNTGLFCPPITIPSRFGQ